MLFVLRKFFVSAFVIFSFAAYAIHERFASPEMTLSPTATTGDSAQTQLVLRPVQTMPTAQLATATPVIIVPASVSDDAEDGGSDEEQENISIAVATDTPIIIPTSTPVPPADTSVSPTDTPVPTATRSGQYADGEYVGPVTDAWYGNMQVKAVVQNGEIVDVQFLDYPHDRRTSQRINSIAMPYLTREVIQAQSARVNLISGATLTSRAFVQSLSAALAKSQ